MERATLAAFSALILGTQVLVDVLRIVADCGGPVVQAFLDMLQRVLCTNLTTGLGMVVWGVIVAGVLLIVMAVANVFLAFFMKNGNNSSSRVVCTVTSALMTTFGFTIGLVAVFNARFFGASAFAWITMGLSIIVWILCSLPSRIWPRTVSMRRVLWGSIGACAVVIFGMSIGLVTLGAQNISECWVVNQDSCQVRLLLLLLLLLHSFPQPSHENFCFSIHVALLKSPPGV